ncbi:MAG: hypothetical protein VX930_12555, partial [Pseudomonadota bacterium]|nr:hypothetical protein [Pseudomonadota bacterium]
CVAASEIYSKNNHNSNKRMPLGEDVAAAMLFGITDLKRRQRLYKVRRAIRVGRDNQDDVYLLQYRHAISSNERIRIFGKGLS